MEPLFRVFLGVLGVGLMVSGAGAAPEKPNILLIFADDVGREVLGCYGGTSYQTPNINALSKSGMQFSSCFAMPVCHPSRTCLLTGQYPIHVGNPRWGDFPRANEITTLAEGMAHAGYQSAIAGKWQLALLKTNPDHPQELGFGNSCVFGWHEGPRYHDPKIYENGTLREETAGTFGPDLYSQFLTDFMREQVANGTPFFALYSMALCHDVTDDLKGRHVPFAKDGRWLSYAEMAAAMDEMVGRMVAAVEELGIRNDTLILFTTDNGTASASYITVDENGKMVKDPVFSEFEGKMIRGGKGTFTDWGTRVPLIASWPGVIEPGSKSDDLIDLTDFLPTLLELAGGELDPETKKIDGVSFASRILENKPAPREWVHVETRGTRFVRTRDYKLYGDGRFIDLAADPDEKKELETDSLAPDQGKSLEFLREVLSGIMGEQ